MTHDDVDIDSPEEIDSAPAAKPSLREVWESSPILKLVAIAFVGIILIGAYVVFSPAEDEKKSMVRLDAPVTKHLPGQQELDPAYRKAVEDANRQAAILAAETGKSALPTPIGTSKTSGLDMQMPETLKSDPLAEWRKARRLTIEKQMTEEDNSGGGMPEIIPMVQPIRPQQPTVKEDSGAAKRLADQMRLIISTLAPAASQMSHITVQKSPYIEQEDMLREISSKAKEDAASGGTSGTSAGKGKIQTITPAGSIAYAQLLNEINSDIKGPVLAQVLSGPFSGGRAIGKIEVKTGGEDYIVITFSRVVKDGVSYGMNGIAMDENTTLTGQATDVDHHYFTRIILPAAAKFLTGYASALSQTGTTVTQTSGGGQSTSQPAPSPKKSIYKGIEESAKQIGSMLQKGADLPVTVKIAKGTTMGILFIDPVTTKDAGK